MAQQRGMATQILLGFESTFKTPPTAAYLMPFDTYGVKATRALNAASTLRNNPNPVKPFAGYKQVAGSIVVPVDSTALGWWLRLLLGTPATSGTGPYTHEFKRTATTALESATIESSYEDFTTDRYRQHKGCKINGFSLTVGGDGELTASLDVIGADYAWVTTSMDATPTTPSLTRLHNFQASITEAAAAADMITEFSMSISHNLDDSNRVINDAGALGSLPEGIMSVGGSLTCLMDDDAYALLAKGEALTETSLDVTISDSASSQLEIAFNEVQVAVADADTSGPAGKKVDIAWQGYYDNDAAASAVVMTLTNSLSSYA